MNIIQTILLTVCTSILIWMGSEVKSFGEFRATTIEKLSQQKADFTELKSQVSKNETDTKNNSNSIIFLMAILPEDKKNKRFEK